MARLARFILPSVAHHITQRGNGRQQTFFSDADYRVYWDLIKLHCAEQGVCDLPPRNRTI
jgi:putative transposase